MAKARHLMLPTSDAQSVTFEVMKDRSIAWSVRARTLKQAAKLFDEARRFANAQQRQFILDDDALRVWQLEKSVEGTK